MGASKYIHDHFDAAKEIDKYDLDDTTFDLVRIKKFHNTKFSTVLAYMLLLIFSLLTWVLLGVDIYTCLNILVFHRWSNDDYEPYAYSIAKWIFTGCIIFEFVLHAYHWIWGIHTYRTKNIALAYVNSIARTLYSLKAYDYHCLFQQIEQDNFFDWSCFFAYREMDNALQILVADTPRQVINVLTLRYYATDRDSLNDILENIRQIANKNLRLSIILSFICLSVVIWSIFMFKFIMGFILFLPVFAKLRKKGYKSLKKYCCDVVDDKVRLLLFKSRKPKRGLLDDDALSMAVNRNNPFSESSTSLIKKYSDLDQSFETLNDITKPSRVHVTPCGYRYNDFVYDEEKNLSEVELYSQSNNSALLNAPNKNFELRHKNALAINPRDRQYDFESINMKPREDNLVFANNNENVKSNRRRKYNEKDLKNAESATCVNETEIMPDYPEHRPFLQDDYNTSLSSLSYEMESNQGRYNKSLEDNDMPYPMNESPFLDPDDERHSHYAPR